MTSRNSDRCPTHPGELLRADVLPAVNRSEAEIAGLLRVPRRQVGSVLSGKNPVRPALAVRLGKLLGNDPLFWLRMQGAYDLWHARREVDVSGIPNLTEK